ncbi:hypothetical protein FJZ20_02130 [Candidatus Pacearchaeota archaeon]|nr:hypothetical protein [Candidatus Pacearchaeota archaeon]
MDEDKINYFGNNSIKDTVLWLRQNSGIREEDAERFAEGLINGRREARVFYESHLPEEVVRQCRESSGDVEGDYVRNLIEKYREHSAICNETPIKNKEEEI